MTELMLELHGVKVQCASDDPKLLQFLEHNLGCFARDEPAEVPDIESAYHRAHKYRNLKDVARDAGAGSQLGTGLYVGQSVVAWAIADWYTCKLQRDPFRIRTQLFSHGGTRPTVRSIGRAVLRPRAHKLSKSIRVSQAMRLLVHFPVFWLLEYTRGIAWETRIDLLSL